MCLGLGVYLGGGESESIYGKPIFTNNFFTNNLYLVDVSGSICHFLMKPLS